MPQLQAGAPEGHKYDPPENELTVQTFAKAVKEKYPEYAKYNDQQLTIAMLQKYPEYQAKFAAATKLGLQRQMMMSEFDKANPGVAVTQDAQGNMVQKNPGTLGSRIREAAIGGLEPFTAGNVFEGLKTMGKAGVDLLMGKTVQGTQELYDIGKGMVQAPIQPVIDIAQGMRTGDWERAAYGSGGFASQTVPAVEGVASAVGKVGSLTGIADRARRVSQDITGTSAFKTTEQTIGDYRKAAADAATRQVESDTAIAGKNVEATNKAINETRKQQAEATTANEAAMNEADIQTEKVSKSQLEADRTAQRKHADETAAVNAHNDNVKVMRQKAESLDSNLREGSKDIGERIVNLEKKLRDEGNSKYTAVREAVKDDPGIPAAEMAAEAQKAKDLLTGSSESIKQIRELSLEADEGLSDIERLQEQGVSKKSIADMIEQGIIGTGENVKFADLQGYSQELGAKLAKGNLLPDVYQALKSLKESLDNAKNAIAKRHNVLPQLAEADNFWHKMLKVMRDKESAVADVRKRVGKLDPEFYAEPFTTGKATGVAAKNLRELPTQYSAEATAIADQAERLRGYHAERKGMKIPAEKPLPTPPSARRGVTPRTMAELEPMPEPVKPKIKPNVVITQPTAPTASDIVAMKRGKLETRAHNLGELHRASLFELISLPTKQAVSNFLKRPGIAEWISRPTSADLAAAAKLPGPEGAALKAGLQKIIDDNVRAGRPMKVAPELRKFLGASATPVEAVAIVGGIKNRQEALRAMGRATPAF